MKRGNTRDTKGGRIDARALRQAISIGPGGRRVLRILVPSACRFSCADCPFELPATAATAHAGLDALARAILGAYRLGLCDGVFLMAGIPRDASAATRALLDLVEKLRFAHGFRGYLHVKALAGAEPVLTERLVRLVDRVSYALEAPCADALRAEGALTPDAARDLEARALAELQRARIASGRSSPPLLPADVRTVRTGLGRGLQPSLFDGRNSISGTTYMETDVWAVDGARA
jgi:predicted DNA-binding helix-hairpin-helix protein